ncbi:hypothetical protein [Alkalihalobacterium chitinilyticum]|uniref:Uncharacterized protein n=1 Tax=Alkalihalobacterium chitinilyticum TaxID=2980103 RepID=A0ABT5VFT6_9BACI|nr:hypothetical protein [Alkalihalobacterium chitinilyticum]MDE5414319.1 hypothetical protein [Alkalihalobacterium chitinilyticum]
MNYGLSLPQYKIRKTMKASELIFTFQKELAETHLSLGAEAKRSKSGVLFIGYKRWTNYKCLAL